MPHAHAVDELAGVQVVGTAEKLYPQPRAHMRALPWCRPERCRARNSSGSAPAPSMAARTWPCWWLVS